MTLPVSWRRYLVWSARILLARVLGIGASSLLNSIRDVSSYIREKRFGMDYFAVDRKISPNMLNKYSSAI